MALGNNYMHKVLLVFLFATSAMTAVGVEQNDVFKQNPVIVPAVNSKPVLELYVTLSDNIKVGESDDGERGIIPITGGYFVGKGIRGEVMPGGADWQTTRPDGVKEIKALYSIKTDDGQVIVVDNQGIALIEGGTRYVRTIPRFHAPKGQYDWLNKKIYTGNITSIKSPRAVVIRVYEVN